MTYNVIFKHEERGGFPEARTLDKPIVLEEGESVLIPEVGDQVTYPCEGLPTTFKVLRRHFSYSRDHCTVGVEMVCEEQKRLGLKE